MKKVIRFFLLLLAFGLFWCLPADTAYAEQPVFKQGMSGDDVLKLQGILKNLGYYHGALDGAFGPGTRSAVAGFQTDHDLEVDGIAGPATLRALSFSSVVVSRGSTYRDNSASGEQGALKRDMSGENVLKLQKRLRELGYYQGALDGAFGPGTGNAVIRFQADYDLDVDGIVGPETLRTLYSNSSRPQPGRGRTESRQARAIVSFARQFLGVPYVWAGSSPSGFDCSGFTRYVFGQHGISLPHMADEQFKTGISVSKPQMGDLVFFTTYEPGPSHVGIYIGDNQFIHASSGAGDVTVTSLSAPYYRDRYLGSRRVIT